MVNLISMSMKQLGQSKHFRAVAGGVGVLLVMLLSFALGVKVGFHKAKFSAEWGRNFERQFLEGPGKNEDRWFPGMAKMMDKGMRNAHGVVGKIISITDSSIIIQGQDNQENTIRLGNDTVINQGRDTLMASDLVVGQRIVVIGKPGDDGVVTAHLIRVFDRVY